MSKRSKNMKNNKALIICLVGFCIVALAYVANELFSPAATGNTTTVIERETPANGSETTPQKRQLSDSPVTESSASASEESKQISKAPRQKQIADAVTEEYTYYAMESTNDPLTANDWALTKTNAYQAWDSMPVTGSTIAVIDSAYALEHEDLQNIWTINAGEQGQTQAGDFCWTGTPENKQTNNCDDDENGYVDDWRGWDFYSVDNSPQAGEENPNSSYADHGTIVAGIIGAESNNGVGIASLGRYHQLMPLQVLSDDGVGYTSDITAAVYYAVDNGADVINMSLGGGQKDRSLQQALNYAEANGVLVIAAAGNCGNSTADFCYGLPVGGMMYPARYSNVIAVGALDINDVRPSFSSYGPELDIVAPGAGSFISTTWTLGNQTSAYATNLYGTSFAAPFVASAAGMLKANAHDLTVKELKRLLVANSRKVPAMSGAVHTTAHGHGSLHASAIIQLAQNMTNGSSTPELLVSGNQRAEQFYTDGALMGAGCEAEPATWCGVSMRSTSGLDRYLPFKQTSAEGRASWAWNTAILHQQIWDVNATQRTTVSAAHNFLTK